MNISNIGNVSVEHDTNASIPIVMGNRSVVSTFRLSDNRTLIPMRSKWNSNLSRRNTMRINVHLHGADCKDSKHRTSAPDIPRIHILNAASLAKPHAIEALSTELVSHDISIAVITETHFKSHHTNSAFNIVGYQYVRRDRVKRRGGGVAIYLQEGITYKRLSPINKIQDFESLWLEVVWESKTFLLSAIYHPPQPIYDVKLFRTFFVDNIDYFYTHYPNKKIYLAGDF